MKAISTILMLLMLLVLMAACASTDNDRNDSTQMKYGGSYRVRGTVSHNK
jgi:hypothetical protein